MGFSLGGLIKSALPAVAHAIPGVSQVYDAVNIAHNVLRAKPPSGPTVLGNLPTLFTGAPAVSSGGIIRGGTGGAPALPGLPSTPGTMPGTSMVPTSSNTSSGTFMTPDGQIHTKDWRGSRGHITKGTKRNPPHWTNRRRPRMNVMNVHAARRAVRRIVGAEKMFRKIFSVTHPGHGGKVHIKRGKK